MSEKNNFTISAVGKGIAFALVLTFLFVLLIAAACYFFTVSDRLLALLVMGGAGISVFAASFFVAKSTSQKGLIYGIATALGYMLVILLSGAVKNGGLYFDIGTFTMLAAVSCFGALGGIFGVR